MTYLDLVNAVLIRLRETEVAAVTDTTYAQLIGALVNDAKRTVEVAWDWQALRSTLTVNATVGDNSYTLTGSGTNFKILDAYNDTNNVTLQRLSTGELNRKLDMQGTSSGAPYSYGFDGLDASGDQNILLYPIPDASYTLKFDCVVREAALSDDADTTALPSHLVEMYAWAFATRERGETGGTSAQEIFSLADRYLADAIAMEASRSSEELTWYPV